MFSFTYISDVCKQRQMILSNIIFYAVTIYRWRNVPFNNGFKALIKNLYPFRKKYSF